MLIHQTPKFKKYPSNLSAFTASLLRIWDMSAFAIGHRSFKSERGPTTSGKTTHTCFLRAEVDPNVRRELSPVGVQLATCLQSAENDRSGRGPGCVKGIEKRESNGRANFASGLIYRDDTTILFDRCPY